VFNTNIAMSVFGRGTFFDSGSFDGIELLYTIDLQGDARHIAKTYTTMSSTFIPVDSHGTFTFRLSHLDLLLVFHVALLSNRVSTPLYVVPSGACWT